MSKTTVQIQLPTEPSYWGALCDDADVIDILESIERMIMREFGDKFALKFERTPNPRGSGVHSDDEDAATDVWIWIRDNWQCAL